MLYSIGPTYVSMTSAHAGRWEVRWSSQLRFVEKLNTCEVIGRLVNKQTIVTELL